MGHVVIVLGLVLGSTTLVAIRTTRGRRARCGRASHEHECQRQRFSQQPQQLERDAAIELGIALADAVATDPIAEPERSPSTLVVELVFVPFVRSAAMVRSSKPGCSPAIATRLAS